MSVAATNRKYFVDVFMDWVASVRTVYDAINVLQPYSYYGSITEIVNHLTIKDQGQVAKYPFICLVDDFNEKHDSVLDWYIVNPTIYIFSETLVDYDPQQRYDNVIKPILFVLMQHLLTAIENSDSYSEANEKIEWEQKIYKGTVAGQSIENTVDCIELKFSNLLIKNNC
jgi:hypothetical protein